MLVCAPDTIGTASETAKMNFDIVGKFLPGT